MFLHVLLQGKRLVTKGTSEGSVTCVNGEMVFDVLSLRKLTIAVVDPAEVNCLFAAGHQSLSYLGVPVRRYPMHSSRLEPKGLKRHL